MATYSYTRVDSGLPGTKYAAVIRERRPAPGVQGWAIHRVSKSKGTLYGSVCEDHGSRFVLRSRAWTAPCRVEAPVRIRGRAGRRRLQTSPSGAPISGVTDSMSTWFSMVDGMAGVAHNELAQGWMQCWMRFCAGWRCSPMPWAAAASCSVAVVVGMARSSCFRDRVF